ncbi:Uncharacterised protein [Neisseria mucosa]|nr:Uncharacterised protein [Neisseria mucosa]
MSIKTFLKTSKNQTNCDILVSSFNHRRSSEEPNYTPLLKNRQLPNKKNSAKHFNNLKFNSFYFRHYFRTLNTLFQNTLNPKSKQLKTTNLHINK